MTIQSDKTVNVLIDQSFSDSDIVCIDIVNSDQPLRIICCYRPPSSDTDLVSVESMNRIIKILEILCETDSTVVLAGDFNLPFIDWSCPFFISDCRHCSTQFNEFVGLFHFISLLMNILDLIIIQMIFLVQSWTWYLVMITLLSKMSVSWLLSVPVIIPPLFLMSHFSQ